MSDEPDGDETVIHEIHSSQGCKVTIKSKRGTGTRDEDEVKIEQSSMDPNEIGDATDAALDAVDAAMRERRPQDYADEPEGDDGE